MNRRRALLVAIVGVISLCPLQATGDARTQEKPIVQIPQLGVPQIMTLEGKFVRVALSDPDRGRGEDPLEELQEHREAGQRRVQAEEVNADAALPPSWAD
jgi:hypothetical protein